MHNKATRAGGGAHGSVTEPAIWVVDDTPAVRLLVADAFARAGWQATAFEDLFSALEALASRPAPAAVILDVHLPDGCGLDEVRAFASAGCAVAVISNLVGPAQIERALAAGAVAVVPKPVDISGLLARFERSVRHVGSGALEAAGRAAASASRAPGRTLNAEK